jgi:hypothetical protein
MLTEEMLSVVMELLRDWSLPEEAVMLLFVLELLLMNLMLLLDTA